jgi:hypothetical protein
MPAGPGRIPTSETWPPGVPDLPEIFDSSIYSQREVRILWELACPPHRTAVVSWSDSLGHYRRALLTRGPELCHRSHDPPTAG